MAIDSAGKWSTNCSNIIRRVDTFDFNHIVLAYSDQRAHQKEPKDSMLGTARSESNNESARIPGMNVIRDEWTEGDECEIYSHSKQKWIRGKITAIFADDAGEWLKVKYGKSTKEIQRYNIDIRTVAEDGRTNEDPVSFESKKV